MADHEMRFPHYALRQGGVSVTRLVPRQIEVCGLPDGGATISILANGREVFHEVLDAASAAHLARLLTAASEAA